MAEEPGIGLPLANIFDHLSIGREAIQTPKQQIAFPDVARVEHRTTISEERRGKSGLPSFFKAVADGVRDELRGRRGLTYREKEREQARTYERRVEQVLIARKDGSTMTFYVGGHLMQAGLPHLMAMARANSVEANATTIRTGTAKK